MATSGDEPRPPLLTRLLKRDWIVLASLAILSGLAWWWLWRMGMAPAADSAMGGMADMQGMQGMSDMPGMVPMPAAPEVWSFGYLGPAFLMWAVMMVAMMLPSATPMILLHAAFTRRSHAAPAAPAVFALTYLCLWAGFAALAAAAQALLIQLGLLEQANLALGNRRLAAALLVAIALYQLSPLKRLCLSFCRAPAVFLTRHWRPGVTGAIRMGLAHGLYCIGCCALLMLLLFIGGVMNLAWVGFITLIVFAEKYAPPRLHANLLISGALLIGAAAMLLA